MASIKCEIQAKNTNTLHYIFYKAKKFNTTDLKMLWNLM